jgi:hypothetical protein
VTTPREVLAAMAGNLETAEQGLRDLIVEPETTRKWAGLRQVVIWGRAVTFALQRMRAVVPDFDDWYGPLQEEMKTDPLLRYFVNLRNQLEKEGMPQGIRAQIVLIEGAPVVRNFRLPDPPSHHLGEVLSDTRIEQLAIRYLDYLRHRIVEPAMQKFGDSSI